MTQADTSKTAPKKYIGISRSGISVLIVTVILGFVVLEVTATVLWKKKYNEWLEEQIHGYDHVDYERNLIVLTPGSVFTAEQYKAELMKHNKPLGLKVFNQSTREDAPSESEVLFQVNSHGFKGPEISIPKPDSVFRILTIGDSCTFFPVNDYHSYPRTMERELNRLKQSELDVEVVNAGVAGYNFERVLKRIDEFLAADPDLVTIYLGWNRTINRADPRKNQFLYRKLSLYRIYYHLMQNRKDTGLQENFQIKTYFDPKEPALGEFKAHSFEFDMQDINTLIDAIKKKNEATQIVIITLAGIFDHRVSPDDRALEIAFPTASTNNLYAWPLLTSIYNNKLRQLVAEDSRVQLFDYEAYALEHFVPRHTYFVDSVHFTNKGYREMGEYFARELLKFIPTQANSDIRQQ